MKVNVCIQGKWKVMDIADEAYQRGYLDFITLPPLKASDIDRPPTGIPQGRIRVYREADSTTYRERKDRR